MTRVVTMLIAGLAVLIAGCGTVERMWSGGPTEQKRVRPGVTEFSCDSNKKLLVRFDAGSKSAWVIFPEREFRLDQVQGASGVQYSNGRATLATQGDEASLEEGSVVTFANCKRSAGG
jgi:membrane-bound inhibitor of C-type lysozyme